MKQWINISLLLLLLAGVGTADVNILIVGNSRDSSYYFGGGSSAFDPGAVGTNLQSILAGAGLGAVNVTVKDRSDYSSSVFSLAAWYHYPSPDDVETTTRWPNLRGELGTAWDYVVLIGDSYTIENMPGVYAHGVAKVGEEVARGTAETILLMPWPASASTSSVDHYSEVVYRAGRSGGYKVAPAGLAWQAAGSPAVATHPNADGAYIAAASIYSRIYGQSSTNSSYTYDDSLADMVYTTVTNNVGKQQYAGDFSFENPFLMLGDKRRHVRYGHRGTSTETGFQSAIGAALARCNVRASGAAPYVNRWITLPPTWVAEAPIAWNHGRQSSDKSYIVNSNYWQLGMGYNYQTQGTWDNDIHIGQMLGEIALADGMHGTGRCVPWRAMWAQIHREYPSLPVLGDAAHLSSYVLGAGGTYMYTLYSGRCPLDPKPDPVTAIWVAQKVGYETAWQMGRCQSRAPGFKVMPTSATVTDVSPTNSQNLSVYFIMAPTSDVTVAISTDDRSVGMVTPSVLTFTPANYDTAQTVTVLAESGPAGSFAFNVGLTTSSADPCYDGVSDSWEFVNTRPAGSSADIRVVGNGFPIVAGDTTPVEVNWTDFFIATGSVTRTFTIINISESTTVNLTNSPIVTLTDGSGYYTLSRDAGTGTLAPGGSTTFEVTYTPLLAGTHDADIAISSSDAHTPVYSFRITGKRAGPPTVVNLVAVPADPTRATLSGQLADGAIANAWIYWGATDGGTTGTGAWDHVVSLGTVYEEPPFSTLVTGLEPNRTYAYRCYVTNAFGEDWNDTPEFFSAIPTVGERFFVQDSGAQGLVSIEAEHFHRNIPGGVEQWVRLDEAGASNGKVMDCSLDDGTVGSPAPQLSVDVQFVRTGSHHVWVRGRAYPRTGASTSADSVDVGFDGVLRSTAATITGFITNSYTWRKAFQGGGNEIIDVTTPGLHTVEIVMREDGFLCDKILLTTDSSHTPSGYGPAESEEKQGRAIGNLAPTGIAADQAVLNASLAAAATNYGVYVHWGTSDGATNPAGWTSSALVGSWTNATSNLSYSVSSLMEGARYYYTFRASNAVSEVWARPSWSFTTPGVPVGPAIDSVDGAMGVTDTNAFLHGRLTSTGAAATTLSCYWNASSDPGVTTAGWDYTRSFGTVSPGNYTNNTAEFAALLPGTTYYYRYRAANSFATNWSAAVSFKTAGPPVVDNNTGATAISTTSAMLNGALNSGLSATAWICWGAADGGTSSTGDWDHVVAMGTVTEGMPFAGMATGLGLSESYWYRCYVENVYGNGWSDSSVTFSGMPVDGRGVPVDGVAVPVRDGLSLWLDASDQDTLFQDSEGSTPVTANGQTVGRWSDKSGAGNHAKQTTDASEPAYITSGFNGLPALHFTGDTIHSTFNANVANMSLFIVYQRVAPNGALWGHEDLVLYNKSWDRQQLFDDGAWRYGTGGSASSITGLDNADTNIYAVLSAGDVANGCTVYVNKSATTTFTDNNSAGQNSITFGGIKEHPSSKPYEVRASDLKIAEVLAYDRVLDGGEHDLVGGYLASKYGLAAAYPAYQSIIIGNLAPTGISNSAATLNARIDASGTYYDVYVYSGTTDGGTNPAAWAQGAYVGSWTNVSTNISYAANSLSAGSRYYYTFMASNTAGAAWASPSWQFRTPGIGAITANHAVPHSWIDAVPGLRGTNTHESVMTDDPDGDGFLTWQEYWSGTDPIDSNSCLRIDAIQFTGSNVVLEWRHARVDAGVPAIVIQRRTNISSGSWTYAGQKGPVDGSNIWISPSSPQGFYRLAVTNAP